MMSRSLSGRLLSLVFSTILTGAIATIPAKADDCTNEQALKSPASSANSEISFQNRAGDKRRIYWIDQDGDRKFYGIVEPGNIFKQPTLVGHAWVVTDDAEKCLYTFVATAEPQTVDVGVVAAAAAPPPPGGQQPIAQAPAAQMTAPPPLPAADPAQPPAAQLAPPPPPVAAAPPPPVAAAPPPPPPVAAAPPPPAAPPAQDPQTVMAEIPQISPVEQFDLRGVFRISPRTNSSIALNSEAAGTIFVMNVKPEWDSGQWVFEPVPGLPFVRIKNQWKKTYLTDVGGKLRATAATPDADEAHWTFEPVDGTPFVQFRNRETDRFLIVAGDAPALVDDLRQNQQDLSQWKVGPTGRAVAVAPPPPPRNSAYDAALANCRELGGYWTGSSCRASINSQPLVCPRGYAWSEEAGECQWDGGSCPPWQIGPGGQCLSDLSCRGGVVQMSRRGFPACYCPLGYVVWGDYPRLSCVPSVARIAPLLIGGVAIAILGTNQGRPQIGQVYGNKKFCGPGQTGTPPNCVAANACPPPLVGNPPNCLRLVPRPVNNPVVAPTKPSPVVGNTEIGPIGQTCAKGYKRDTSRTEFFCIPTTQDYDKQCGPNSRFVNGQCQLLSQPCPDGKRFVGSACLIIPACIGGTVSMDNGCDCPSGMEFKSESEHVFRCVAATGRTPNQPAGTPTNPVCQLGQRLVDGKCVDLNAAITCTGGTIAQGVCGCPQGTRLTGSGNNFQCVAANAPNPPTNVVVTPGGTPANPVCSIGQRLVDGKCVDLNAAITCSGGTIAQGVCGCPQGTRLTGSGNNFQCVAANAPNPPTNVIVTPGGTPANPVCSLGQRLVDGKCVDLNAAITCTGGTIAQGVCGCPQGTRLTGSGNNFQCVAAGAQNPGTTPVVQPNACGPNRVGTPPNCQCAEGRSGPNCAPDAPCNPLTQTGTPGKCVDKVIPCEGGTVDRGSGTCVCGSGKGVVNGRCVAKTCSGGQMVGDQCRCNNPNQTAQRTSFTTFVCTGSGAGACPSDSTGTPPSCICKTGTTGQPGSCKPAGTGAPAGGGAVAPPACPSGMTGTPPNCVANPKVDRVPAKCPDGMTGTPPNCVQPPPAKCPDGMTGTPPNCARAAPAKCPDGMTGTPPNCAPNPKVTREPPKCPDGTTGTPPNCKANPPPPCPAGTTGTPPNCKANPPPTCPAGTTGTPPNCKANPPPTCPAGTTGTPPNCKANPPPACPAGTTGTPPNCKANPPPACPAGTTGTPPNCLRPPPQACPTGTTGIPPNCRPAQTAPQPQPKPTGGPPACAPPKKLLPNGQCV